MDPAIAISAVVGALTTVAALYHAELLRRAKAAETDALYWRDRALGSTALAEMATDVAERRRLA